MGYSRTRLLGLFVTVVAAACAGPDVRSPELPPPPIDQLRQMGSTPDFPVSEYGIPCESLDPADAAQRAPGALEQRIRNGERFRCALSSGDTATVALVVDEADPAFHVVSALRIVDAAGRTIDSLPGTASEPPPPRTPFLVAQDLDFDGTRELKLLSWSGATGNTGWIIFRRDARTRRMVRDTTLTGLGDPEPLAALGARCLRVVGTGGHVGMIRTISVYCWDGERLPELFRSRQDWNDSTRRYVRRLYARTGGGDSLALVATESFPPPGNGR